MKLSVRVPFLVVAFLAVMVCGTALSQETPAAPPAAQPPTTTAQPVATEPPATATAAAPAEPAATPAEAVSDPEMATVIIYRAKSMVGMALRPTVMLDGKDLVNVGNGKVWKGSFKPGHYLFEMDDRKSKADLDLVKGETYYFQVSLVPGLWKAGGKLTQVMPQQGINDIVNLKPVPEKEIEHPMFKEKK